MTFARRGTRGLYSTGKEPSESSRAHMDKGEQESLDSLRREIEKFAEEPINWWEVWTVVLICFAATIGVEELKKRRTKETKEEPKGGSKEEPKMEPKPQPKAQPTESALHEAFGEEMQKLASNATTFNLDIDDYMKRMIAGVWVAQKVQLPDPTDIHSIHNYLKGMVVVMDLIHSVKPGQGPHREIVEIFDFEPRTLRKLVKSSPDPSMFRFAKKAEKSLYDIQLQACWDIHNILHPESEPNPESDTRTQQMYELYVEEVLEVIVTSIRNASRFTPVFKDVIERAKDIELMRRWVRKHPMWLTPGSGGL